MYRILAGLDWKKGTLSSNDEGKLPTLLTKAQVAEWKQGMPCSKLAELGHPMENVWGWVSEERTGCRCYAVDCPGFASCRPGVDASDATKYDPDEYEVEPAEEPYEYDDIEVEQPVVIDTVVSRASVVRKISFVEEPRITLIERRLGRQAEAAIPPENLDDTETNREVLEEESVESQLSPQAAVLSLSPRQGNPKTTPT